MRWNPLALFTATPEGRVTEADGAGPVGSAQVVIVGTRMGALTGAGGEYRIVKGRVTDREDAEIYMPGEGYWIPGYLTWNLTASEWGEARRGSLDQIVGLVGEKMRRRKDASGLAELIRRLEATAMNQS